MLFLTLVFLNAKIVHIFQRGVFMSNNKCQTIFDYKFEILFYRKQGYSEIEALNFIVKEHSLSSFSDEVLETLKNDFIRVSNMEEKMKLNRLHFLFPLLILYTFMVEGFFKFLAIILCFLYAHTIFIKPFKEKKLLKYNRMLAKKNIQNILIEQNCRHHFIDVEYREILNDDVENKVDLQYISSILSSLSKKISNPNSILYQELQSYLEEFNYLKNMSNLSYQEIENLARKLEEFDCKVSNILKGEVSTTSFYDNIDVILQRNKRNK